MPGLVQESPFRTFTVRELHPTFGAEVQGVDFQNLRDETLQEIVAAVVKYGVCVFRNTGLDDDAHVSMSKRIGDLDDIRRFVQGTGRKMRYSHMELFDAGNLDGDGNVIDPDSPRAHANRGNTLFHADSSFNPRRASFSLLRAVVIPPEGTGGETEFADSRAAFDELPDETRRELLERDYVGLHSMSQSRKLGSPDFFRDLDPASAGPMARHRVAQLHGPSGRMNLYVGAHLHSIEGLDPDESAALVRRLQSHATRPRHVFSLRWEQPGDMVVWDNRCVLHRAAGGSFEGCHRRDLRRTTVHDDGPTAWGENEVGSPMLGFFGVQKGQQQAQQQQQQDEQQAAAVQAAVKA